MYYCVFPAADDSDEGGQVYTYFFTEDMSFSCQTLALPVSQLEQYRDTVFIASINIPQGSVFQLGPPSTATITVEGIIYTISPVY